LRRSGASPRKDPIGLAGGLNLYGFANGDPVNFSDPFGLCPPCGVDVGSSIIAAIEQSVRRNPNALEVASPFLGGLVRTFTEPVAVTPAGLALSVMGLGFASSVSVTGTRFLGGATAQSFGNKVASGTVDLRPVLGRIESGEARGHVFLNRGGLLPEKPVGFYRSYDIPTPGVQGRGPQRLIRGEGGELFYTGDHYKTFTPVRP